MRNLSRPSSLSRAVRCAVALAVAAAASASGTPTQAVPAPAASPARASETGPWLDTRLDFEARARDLVSRMTTAEKISQLTNQAAAIPRLGVPEYEWWNEALHGVARAGVATVFPQAIGLAATFDVPLFDEMSRVIADEARAKHHQFVREGRRQRYQGLTFWSPNINIFRDPRWGRGQETYGEDPFLTARLGVAFVKGLQGNDPRYYKVIATAKHYAVHSGPEPERHHFDARPSERDLHDTYLPAFRALVEEGRAASVMSAYNRVNGESATASQRLLQDILRREWGFAGYVVSDCGAVDDIYLRHKLVATPEEAAALALTRGCELECGSVYKTLGKALERGLLKESDVDAAVERLMLARMKLGMFDPPEQVAYARVPYSVNDAPEHDRLARKVAQKSIVLLKNDGLLPLRRDLRTIAVVGPTADDVVTLLGNYHGTPSRPVTILDGIRNAVPQGTRVLYARGVDLVLGRSDPRAAQVVPSSALRPVAGSKERGLTAEYFRGRELAGEPVMKRVEPKVDVRWYRGSPTDEPVARGELDRSRALDGDSFSARWTGVLVPPATGEYELVATANDGVRLFVDGQKLVDEWTETSVSRALTARVQLTAGREHALRLEFLEAQRDAEIRLGWRPPASGTPFEEAVAAAKQADAVVFVGGLTAEVEGEEMRVSYPGFAGGDRTDIQLPAVQQQLLEAVHATGKPVVLVLTTGSALAVRWAQEKLPAIVLAWYPGQQGGHAVADVLFGGYNPAGRLPVTFYRSVDQLPAFADYAMQGRTYRYFGGEALYPFGHGLSYTRFAYADLRLSREQAAAGDAVEVSLDVRNAGERDGEEVVQLYVREAQPAPGAPLRELRGFERVHLKRGETKRVRFTLLPKRDLSRYDEGRKAVALRPGEYVVEVGASSADLKLNGRLRVD